MEVLQLNLNIVEDAATAAQHRHTKLDWRERKRQAQQRREARRQHRSRGAAAAAAAALNARAATATGHRPTPSAPAAARGTQASPAKRQRLQGPTQPQQQQQQQQHPYHDSLHGYDVSAAEPPVRSQKNEQQQQQQQPKPSSGHAPSHRPLQHTVTSASAAAAAPKQGRKPCAVVKGAVAELQETAEASWAAGPDEQQDIMALVAASVSREQQLHQDLAAAAADAPAAAAAAAARAGAGAGAGVVEFGDAEDEPDYATLLTHKPRQQQQQQQQQQSGPGSRAGGPAAPAAAPAPAGKQAQAPLAAKQQAGQQLVRMRAGQLTHAEPNVPAAARLQLFGAPAPTAAGAVAGGGAAKRHKGAHVGGSSGGITAAAAAAAVAAGEEEEAAAAAAGTGSATWVGLGLCGELAAHLEALNFQEPTQVQKQAIPALLGGRDALVRSPTGSGKTLAYLAPLVHSLAAAAAPRISRDQGTFGIVVVPTRELAVQVNDVLTALLRRFCWLVPGILIGGEHRGHEKARLRKGVTVLVATPGRLMDHLQNTASFKTDRLAWLVLDEADRLLDLGFEHKLAAIIAALDARSSSSSSGGGGGSGASNGTCVGSGAGTGVGNGAAHAPRRQRQTVLLSATLHPGLTALAGLSLRAAVAVGFKAAVDAQGRLQLAAPAGQQQDEQQQWARAVGGGGAAAASFELPQQLRQEYVEVAAKMRLVYLIGALQSRLRRSRASKLVVFFSNCDSVEYHHELFTRSLQLAPTDAMPAAAAGAEEPVRLLGAAPVCKLHGDMPQPERTSALVTFAKAKSCVLLCTDVAARGLDFPAVSTIIQYDPAGEPAEYVHRVGRTARMGQQGEALLFLLPSELPYVQLLQQHGMQLAQEKAGDLLRTLPALLARTGHGQHSAGAGRAGGSGGGSGLLRLARKLQQESRQAGTEAAAAAAAGGNSGLSAQRAEQMAAALLLQRQLLAAVAADAQLRQMALDAFRSYVRAYATHPSALKHVFHIKSLHLGHLAASFGLREAPSRIGSSGAVAERKKRKAQGQAATQRREKAAWHRNAAAAAAGGA